MTSDDSRMEESPMDDFELDRRLDALTRVAEVPPENWRRIERRIRRRRWTAIMPAAIAAAAFLSGIAVVVTQVSNTPAKSSLMARVTQAEVQAMRAGSPRMPQLSEIRADLDAGLDPTDSLIAAWAQNQAAIAELEQAIERDPQNGLLLEFLTEARMRQARLARRITQEQISPNQRSIAL